MTFVIILLYYIVVSQDICIDKLINLLNIQI